MRSYREVWRTEKFRSEEQRLQHPAVAKDIFFQPAGRKAWLLPVHCLSASWRWIGRQWKMCGVEGGGFSPSLSPVPVQILPCLCLVCLSVQEGNAKPPVLSQAAGM